MTDWILIAVVLIVGLALIKWAGAIFFKLIGFLILLGLIGFGLYYYELGPFKNFKSVNLLEEKFCKEDTDESFKCECIVQIIDRDMNKRYSARELRELESKKGQMLYSMFKSFEANKAEIEQCLKENNAEHEMEEFVKELFRESSENGLDFLNHAKDFLRDKIDSLGEMWKDVEDRYKD